MLRPLPRNQEASREKAHPGLCQPGQAKPGGGAGVAPACPACWPAVILATTPWRDPCRPVLQRRDQAQCSKPVTGRQLYDAAAVRPLTSSDSWTGSRKWRQELGKGGG